MTDKLHKLEELVSKKDLGKMRQMIASVSKGFDTDEFDAEKLFEGKLTEKEFVRLAEWPSLILKASYIAAKTAKEHLGMTEIEFWATMYKQSLSLYLLCRQSRSKGAAIECLKVMISCMVRYSALGGSSEDLDTSEVFKKGWATEDSGVTDGGIEL
jgi:hypothetical protein